MPKASHQGPQKKSGSPLILWKRLGGQGSCRANLNSATRFRLGRSLALPANDGCSTNFAETQNSERSAGGAVVQVRSRRYNRDTFHLRRITLGGTLRGRLTG